MHVCTLICIWSYIHMCPCSHKRNGNHQSVHHAIDGLQNSFDTTHELLPRVVKRERHALIVSLGLTFEIRRLPRFLRKMRKLTESPQGCVVNVVHDTHLQAWRCNYKICSVNDSQMGCWCPPQCSTTHSPYLRQRSGRKIELKFFEAPE